MQNPNEDTQWNDILRSKGIIPPKEKEITENDVVEMLESTIAHKSVEQPLNAADCSLEELDGLEDDLDEEIILKYRNARIAEIKALSAKAKYGFLMEITAQEYVQQVNNAGEGVWVVLHLYKPGIPLCSLLNQHLTALAGKFPATKFIKSISSLCIPNYPDTNLPTIFIYYEGDLKKQFIGPFEFRGMNLSEEELEWMIGSVGAVPTELTKDPKPKVKDMLFSKLGVDTSDDGNDW